MLFLEDLVPGMVSNTAKSGSRTYTVPNSKIKYPSVTTVISKFEPKFGLIKWKQEQGDKATEITRRCAAVGTKTHKCNECYFDKKPYSLDFSDENQEVLTRHLLFLDFLELIHPLFLEQKMYWSGSKGGANIGFAGSADIVGTVAKDFKTNWWTIEKTEGEEDKQIPFELLPEGTLFVADYKNFLKAKTADRLLSKYLQAAAYAIAVENVTGGKYRPETGLVVGTTKTMLNIFYLGPREMAWYKYWFIKLVEAYFFKTTFDWTTFSEHSGGYKLNPEYDDADGKDSEVPKWISREENYLATKLYTHKHSKKDLMGLKPSYLSFTNTTQGSWNF